MRWGEGFVNIDELREVVLPSVPFLKKINSKKKSKKRLKQDIFLYRYIKHCISMKPTCEFNLCANLFIFITQKGRWQGNI